MCPVAYFCVHNKCLSHSNCSTISPPDNWYYAVGATQAYGGGIPGADGPEQQVEFYVKDNTLLHDSGGFAYALSNSST